MAEPQNLIGLQNLELRLGYAFQDIGLLDLALTHRSYGPMHNERLEYLGDAILGMIIAKRLYDLFPSLPEGLLTRMRSTLVRETMLAEIAREFDIGDYMHLGNGELHTGGSKCQSMIADAMESIIGAMFIDTHENYPLVRKVVLSWYDCRIAELNPDDNQKDHKSLLQEYLQSRHSSLPVYRITSISENGPRQLFVVSCIIENLPSFTGRGTSKRRAEQEAAGAALAWIQEHSGNRHKAGNPDAKKDAKDVKKDAKKDGDQA